MSDPKLTDAQVKRLLQEIANLPSDDDIIPATLEEVAEIEAFFDRSDQLPTHSSNLPEYLEEYRRLWLEEHRSMSESENNPGQCPGLFDELEG